MKANFLPAIPRIISPLLAVLAFGSLLSERVRAATFNTYTEAISESRFFKEAVVWVGEQPPAEPESQTLWQILDGWRASHFQVGLQDIEMFLEAYTNSPWAPSLHANLGQFYRDRGLISPALEHWEAAWALTRYDQDVHGKAVCDYTLAHWTLLLASLGRYETLAALFEENKGRVLDQGPLSQIWLRTREVFVDMTLHPEHSYQCGTLAMDNVAQALGLKYDARALVSVPSPTNGFSMQVLADLSGRLGLGLVPVSRDTDNRIVVPSVVHWAQGHYAAIVGRVGSFYKVLDPTFGNPAYLTADAINAEASGYFLVPANQIPAGWRMLGTQESSLIYGQGGYNAQDDPNNQSCDTTCPPGCPPGGSGPGPNGNRPVANPDDTSGSGGRGGGHKDSLWGNDNNEAQGGCSSCQGMPVWRVDEPYINLWLTDEPLSYQPALGARISLLMQYKQRETQGSPGFNFGNGWDCSWLSYIETDSGDTPTLSMHLKMPNGGYLHFDFTNGWATNYYNNYRLQVMTNGSGTVTNYTLYKPDGSKIVYDFFRTDSYGNWYEVFMSQQVDPQGNAVQFQYPDYDPATTVVLLKYVVDADGRTNTLDYLTDDTYYKNRVGTVTDPFGRTVTFGRQGYMAGANVMTNITDVAGMTSSFIYDGNGWVTNLTTPYGTTSFVMTEDPVYVDRTVIIHEPNGSSQAYQYIEVCNDSGQAYYQTAYSSSLVPTNTPIGTLDNDPSYRNSFYWGRQQYATLPSNFKSYDDFSYLTSTNDYLVARMRHWLGGAEEGAHKPIDTLSIERDFSPDGTTLGQLTWYDYANKGAHGNDDKGTQIMPGVVARVLPDGSTWYTSYEHNGWGIPTSTIETYTKSDGSIGTRTNSFGYASNGIDLLTLTNASGVRVSSNYFNAYHQVLTNYNASNEVTIYTYNGNGQLTSTKSPGGLTTTNIYFTSGDSANRLDRRIDLEIARTNAYTYYTNGLVATHTDDRNLTTTNYWDDLQRLTGMKYPDTTTSSNVYTYLDLAARKDRLDNWTYYGYNSIRQKVAETNGNSVVTRYGYCDCGALMYVTNAFGTSVEEVTSYGYDYQGNRIYVYPPYGTAITNWFDSLRRPIATADDVGTRWFGYNNQGLRTSITNGVGVERTVVFDIEDRVYSSAAANGVTVTNTYDDLGRLRTRTYPDSGVEAYGYTANFPALASYTNQVGNVWTYAYDAALRKTNEVGVGIYTNSFTYNAGGDLLTHTDGNGQVTSWNYNEYGLVTNKVDQASVEILRYTYDADGRLASRWSKAKNTTYYTNDAVGNLTCINYPSSHDITLQYDANNRLTNMVDAAGTNSFTYYAGGLLATEDGPFSNDTMTNTYNNARLRSGLALQQAAGTWTNGFTYDAAHRLSTVTSSAGTFTYTYETPGALVKKLALPNTSYITNTYDSVARLTGTYLDNSSNTVLDQSEYLYNAANQRIRLTRTDSSYYTNHYDAIGQLGWADSTVASEDRGYVYDAAWNLNKRTNNTSPTTFSVDSKNQLSSVGGLSCGYDNNGNLTSYQYLHTQSGYQYYYYTYDDENQLTQVATDTSLTPTGSRWRSDFVYDGLGRLRQETDYIWLVGTGWYASGGATYVYDGRRVIQQRGQVAYTWGTDLSGTFEGAGGIGGLLARSHGYQLGSGAFTNHNYYHADGGGNITYMVDTNQSMVASYRYDPFGNTISSSGTLASANLYRFSTKMIHANSTLYYCGYRWYYPNFQRWLNRDPINEAGFEALRRASEFDEPARLEHALRAMIAIQRAANLYSYELNDPLNQIDPLGLVSLPPGYCGPNRPYDPSCNPFAGPWPDFGGCVKHYINPPHCPFYRISMALYCLNYRQQGYQSWADCFTASSVCYEH